MQTLSELLNHRLPGYYPTDCDARTYAELTSERPALKSLLETTKRTVIWNVQRNADVRRVVSEKGRYYMFCEVLDALLQKDQQAFIAREMGIEDVDPELGNVYAEYCDWEDMNKQIEYLDFQTTK